jgi:hypothetical protein
MTDYARLRSAIPFSLDSGLLNMNKRSIEMALLEQQFREMMRSAPISYFVLKRGGFNVASWFEWCAVYNEFLKEKTKK